MWPFVKKRDPLLHVLKGDPQCLIKNGNLSISCQESLTPVSVSCQKIGPTILWQEMWPFMSCKEMWPFISWQDYDPPYHVNTWHVKKVNLSISCQESSPPVSVSCQEMWPSISSIRSPLYHVKKCDPLYHVKQGDP